MASKTKTAPAPKQTARKGYTKPQQKILLAIEAIDPKAVIRKVGDTGAIIVRYLPRFEVSFGGEPGLGRSFPIIIDAEGGKHGYGYGVGPEFVKYGYMPATGDFKELPLKTGFPKGSSRPKGDHAVVETATKVERASNGNGRKRVPTTTAKAPAATSKGKSASDALVSQSQWEKSLIAEANKVGRKHTPSKPVIKPAARATTKKRTRKASLKTAA